jgi:competence protein ComEC
LAALAGGCVVALRRRSLVLAAIVAVAAACAVSASLRVEGTERSLVVDAAEDRAFVELVVVLTTDPTTRAGRFGDYVVARGTVLEISRAGVSSRTRAPVLLLGRGDWRGAAFGATVRVAGRLAPPLGGPEARLSATRSPEVVSAPPRALEAAAVVRHGVRAAAAGSGPVARELVPGLVVGDDAGLPTEVVADFRDAGLTHLTAVSGTNLTLVVGFLLIVARWCGVRARGLLVVGALGVVGFVLLARPEPSVVRAAAMGTVALMGLGSDGRERGVRALSVAVLVLLLLDPWLARSPGFALSAGATAGILFLGPPTRDALARWLPRWAAEALAVPWAAQLACTPLVAAISGSVSLVAVLANVLVAPVVGPATVLGLLGGVLWPLLPFVGSVLGRCAGGCAWWIILVADRAAALPTGAVSWPTGPLALTALTMLCLGLALGAPRFLAHRGRTVVAALLAVSVMIRPPPHPGWPPAGWVLVACDVGQGDGLVLNAGDGAAVVVDTGPEPRLMDHCLRRLHIDRVPLVVLTHFHADHVDGLPGALRGRSAGEVFVTALRDPPEGADQVDRDAAGLEIRVPAYGETGSVGAVSWQVVGPSHSDPTRSEGVEEGSPANDASLVLLVEVRGVRMLLTGDAEPPAQERLDDELGPLTVDVLKVPHHGSRYQDEEFLAGLGARLALVSAGEDNQYRHPSSSTLDLLGRAGMEVRRTDLDGDVAVLMRDGELRVATSE